MAGETPGDTPLTPQAFEVLAQSYALRISAGDDIELDSVPAFPKTLKPRVEYLLSQME